MINYRAIARKNQVPFATGDIRLRLILASYNLCKGASLPQGNNHFFMIVWDSRNILEDMLPTIPKGCTSKHCLFSYMWPAWVAHPWVARVVVMGYKSASSHREGLIIFLSPVGTAPFQLPVCSFNVFIMALFSR